MTRVVETARQSVRRSKIAWDSTLVSTGRPTLEKADLDRLVCAPPPPRGLMSEPAADRRPVPMSRSPAGRSPTRAARTPTGSIARIDGCLLIARRRTAAAGFFARAIAGLVADLVAAYDDQQASLASAATLSLARAEQTPGGATARRVRLVQGEREFRIDPAPASDQQAAVQGRWVAEL